MTTVIQIDILDGKLIAYVQEGDVILTAKTHMSVVCFWNLVFEKAKKRFGDKFVLATSDAIEVFFALEEGVEVNLFTEVWIESPSVGN